MSWKAALPAAFVVALVALFLRGLTSSQKQGEIRSPFIGKPAPTFDLESLHEPTARVALSQFRGRPFLVNVWGTWCVGCRQEHATLMRIKATGTVPIVGFNWRDERPAALSYLGQAGDPYAAVGYDPNGAAAIDWGVYGAPETFLVDASGTVVHKFIGPLDWSSWQNEFVARLQQGATP